MTRSFVAGELKRDAGAAVRLSDRDGILAFAMARAGLDDAQIARALSKAEVAVYWFLLDYRRRRPRPLAMGDLKESEIRAAVAAAQPGGGSHAE